MPASTPVQEIIPRAESHPEFHMLPALDLACPYCGETITLLVDASAGEQQYIEDCQVCCRPIRVDVALDPEGEPRVTARTQDEA